MTLRSGQGELPHRQVHQPIRPEPLCWNKLDGQMADFSSEPDFVPANDGRAHHTP